MRAESKSIILAESSRLIGQIGNNIVLDLYARVREVEALARTLATTAEHLPKSESGFKQLIPSLIDFQGDLSIAGGGVWPEPHTFSAGRDRRSFFWGRNPAGNLEYYDDYNQPGPGYHHEAWYVVGRYTRSGQCAWSASYMDPYSYQPMVTCTAPFFETGKFAGVVTIDLKLEGLQAFIENWRKKTGGYIFVLDRNNRFITFPDPLLVKNITQDAKANLVEEFMVADEFTSQQPLFSPIALAVSAMNQAILQQAKNVPFHQLDIAQNLTAMSYQIDQSEADLIAATLADPLNIAQSLGERDASTYLHQNFEVANDFLLREASTVFLFHVPRTYWKIVIVKPFSEAAMATYSIIQSEKMSGLGQLVAGVAHEVNNPINFIYANLIYANAYTKELLKLIQLYQQHYPIPPAAIQSQLEASDLDFIVVDLPKILASMQVGADRIRQLVLSLRNFARMDEAEVKSVDIHEGLESTLLLLDSRLKAQSDDYPGIQIIKAYGNLPRVECYPGPLNQVFMNLLVNAIDALEEAIGNGQWAMKEEAMGSGEDKSRSPIADHRSATIQIQTELLGNQHVRITIADNGPGIPEAAQQRLFDPFFTTKPVGKGTGLGLAICYQIVTEKHQGNINYVSTSGQGTEFYIEIPIQQ